jgi:hypothetical protein
MRAGDYTYPPELIEAMRLAFHKTCNALSDKDDAIMEIVATRIVELAKTGERDPDRLCSQALDALSASRESSEDKSTKQVGLSEIRAAS